MDCPLREKCYRYMARPDTIGQSWSKFEFTDIENTDQLEDGSVEHNYTTSCEWFIKLHEDEYK